MKQTHNTEEDALLRTTLLDNVLRHWSANTTIEAPSDWDELCSGPVYGTRIAVTCVSSRANIDLTTLTSRVEQASI
jgi:hypothetical protein